VRASFKYAFFTCPDDASLATPSTSYNFWESVCRKMPSEHRAVGSCQPKLRNMKWHFTTSDGLQGTKLAILATYITIVASSGSMGMATAHAGHATWKSARESAGKAAAAATHAHERNATRECHDSQICAVIVCCR